MKASKSKEKAATDAAKTAAASEEVKPTECLTWKLIFSIDVQVFSFLLLIASCIFSNGIRGELTFDDHLAIEKNHDANANQTTLSDVFFDDFWGKSLDRIESNGSYRPIVVLTFRIQHWLMGYRHSPAFLHCFNYVVAFMNVCLVYYLARLYVYVIVPPRALSLEKANVQSFTAVLTSPLHAVPLVASLLYLVHPVHVDAVTSIVGRCELLYCLFGLVGFFCVHRYLNQVEEPASSNGGRPGVPPVGKNGGGNSLTAAAKAVVEDRRRGAHSSARVFTFRYVVFSIYALILSVLCKDSAITFTAVYGVHACVMYACNRCSRRRMGVVIGVALVELVSYLAFRRNFVGNVDLKKSPLLRQTENPQYFVPEGLFHWLSLRWVVQVKNMELLFFPTSLCCEYSFNCIPHMYDLRDPRVPYFTAVTAVIMAAVLYLLHGTFVRRSRVAVVGLVSFLWIAIPYAPVSHIFIAVGTFIAERCLYVPSIGAVLLITFLVAAPGLRRGGVSYYFYALLLLCVGWGVFSHRRNNDWRSDELLFRAALRTCPNSGKAHVQLAALLSERTSRVTPEILALAERAVELDPGLRDAYYYIALHEVNDKKNPRKAYEYIRMCVSDPFSSRACSDAYMRLRDIMYPAMTEVEQLVDFASLRVEEAQKAVALRQASIYALQKEQKPCLAEALLENALDKWNTSKVYWISSRVERTPGEDTYCNAMYWYPQSMMLCEESTKEDDSDGADAASSAAHANLVVAFASRKTPGRPDPAGAARRAVEIADRLRLCGTDWRHVSKEPKYYRPTYSLRMTQFLTLSDSATLSMERYLNLTARDTPERTAVLLAMLDVSVREYCHLCDLIHDAEVRERVSRHYPNELHSLEQGFSGFRQRRQPQMRAWRRELKLTQSLNATQEAKLHDILATSKCSDDLSFLYL
ncbi:hypothetical protein ABB37_08684 [Leptomonas pyrrhocoris]|uniref:DUF1736 domain-containing protein n=1 Tax=Leptomonas pyrrhocoris TaxID=157538 RepID=A0A0N0DS38_LEPPY|nr:hypothetical protein ABB37_08684 [Leptomonas pyrrhocoris]XP_015653854.1 hypothetical protein ABB37_08684 [Leptomonas pyrrhocoris]KPA75414.1 hypothetical protein ABB37_08684 [Leptomonas pyrrhocoris]KPA75415.1 hypothetical protein ABB37_08684 [Leptomonas pyrrhocoris]|eukprot:XP_015653853.1 hypothetical protein ABB37_08684 [Leptomonas pyrrhocoris]